LIVGQRNCDTRPIGRHEHFVFATELLREVFEEWLVGAARIASGRLERAHGKPDFCLGGGRGRERGYQDADSDQCAVSFHQSHNLVSGVRATQRANTEAE
jgi:hypothetical protein